MRPVDSVAASPPAAPGYDLPGATPLTRTPALTNSPSLLRLLLPFVAVTVVLVGLTLAGYAVLSGVRAYVGGESLWSKARGDATTRLRMYVLTGDRSAYDAFRAALALPLGDRRARLALESPAPDIVEARLGFLAGGNHADDIDGMIRLFRCCAATPLMRDAVAAWREGDARLDELLRLGQDFHERVGTLPAGLGQHEHALRLLHELEALEQRIVALESRFSASLGVASRRTFALLAAAQLALAVVLMLAAAAFVRHGLRERESTQAAARQAEIERATAERVEKARVAFLSRLSHELRTPLNAVIGFSELMLADRVAPLAGPSRQRTTYVLEAGRHLLHLVDEVLDLTRIDSGAVAAVSAPVRVGHALDRALVLAATEVQRHGIAIVRDGHDDVFALGDPQRLEQVFLNLASNGCKYNRPGGRLSIAAERRDAWVRISFADEGEGLSPEQIGQLFQPFRTMSRRRDVQSVGLGLVIVKVLVERMNGRIEVESDPGRGSTFIVVLPAA